MYYFWSWIFLKDLKVLPIRKGGSDNGQYLSTLEISKSKPLSEPFEKTLHSIEHSFGKFVDSLDQTFEKTFGTFGKDSFKEHCKLSHTDLRHVSYDSNSNIMAQNSQKSSDLNIKCFWVSDSDKFLSSQISELQDWF